MSSEKREEVILSEIQKIQDSKQTVRDYFENNYVPFSREQYYRYCRIIKKQGEKGLRAYPKSPDALNVIHAHAKCNNAR